MLRTRQHQFSDVGRDDDRAWRRPHDEGPGTATTTVALVALDGIVIDEATTFRSIFRRWPGARVVTVGRRRGRVTGVGGEVEVELGFDEIDRCDILLVPGSIGSETAGADPVVAAWIESQCRRARWVLASSTGTLLLARAGVALGDRAASHWLAREHLADYGIAIHDQPVHEHRQILTAGGWLGARDAALRVTEREHGVLTAAAIEAAIAPRADAPARRSRRHWWCRRSDR